MNIDDLHLGRSRKGGQGVFFEVKKGGENFFLEKKRGAKSFLPVQNPQNPAYVPGKF